MQQYKAVYDVIDTLERKFAHQPSLATMIRQCYPNTLETTVTLLEDNTTFVFTGDIPAMWLRDSSAQVQPYMPCATQDATVQRLIAGLIRRQAMYIALDPYANAFNREPNGQGHKGDKPTSSPWVWERKFELDSLCYPVWLCYNYWKTTHDATIFDSSVYTMLKKIVEVMKIEQHHNERSTYTFERPDPFLPSDNMPCAGKGTPTTYTGMIWSAFRPSDDACTYGYLIPANMFAVVILGYIAEIAWTMYKDEELAKQAHVLCQEIEAGIQTYGIVEHLRYGRIYAYETDGYGHYNLMDDANVPSLLSIPYIGYRSASDTIYQNTRLFVLSPDNPYYFKGTYAHGVGSPHTPQGYIWPIALIMRGLTSQDIHEQAEILSTLVATTGGTGYMHESFHADDPHIFTRSWFAWANSLFAEFVQRYAMR